MNIKQLKAKIKNRRPWSEKKKALLKGLLFGFLAGGLATITAVGVVGCSMTQDKAQTNEPTQKALAFNGGGPSEQYYIDEGSYTFKSVLPALSENWTLDVYGLANGREFSSIRFYSSPLSVAFYFSSYETYYANGAWISSDYRDFSLYYGSYVYSNAVYSWFVEATAEEEPPAVSSSAEQSSAEESSDEQSSESGGASSSVSTTIEEVSTSFALQFSETNPFSAWAINPSNQEPAANYDSAAPWLLYTGTPSSSTMGSVTAEYRTYSVGSFYIDGNPAQTFDAIAITTLTLSPDNSFVVGGASEAQLVGEDAYNKGAFIVAKAFYLNTANESRVQVMDFATTSAKLGNSQVNALTGPAWLNVGFRNIVYVGQNPNLEINGYTAPAAWWLKNNALSSSAAVATMLLGNAETGVFGLLASAFSGLGGILGIAIIPGLTIGTLMFIPLVVIIVFAIIKVLNK